MGKFPAPFEGHSHRKLIELNHHLVPSDMYVFETLIVVTDDDLADKAYCNGYDILFADEHQNQLEYERRIWNPVNGHLRAIVKVPRLSSSKDTKLWMYFGKRTEIDHSRHSPSYIGPPATFFV